MRDSIIIVSNDKVYSRMLAAEIEYMGYPADVREDIVHEAGRSPLLYVCDLDYVADTKDLHLQFPVIAFSKDERKLEKSGLEFTLQRPFPISRFKKMIIDCLGDENRTLTVPYQTDVRGESELVLDPVRLTVSSQGRTLSLSPTEFALLETMISANGETVSREELKNAICKTSNCDGNTLEVYVCRLRKKIEDTLGQRMIRTVHKKGYKL